MHILFLTDNFPPETNAPASRTHEHTRRWVAAGHRVTVVTTAPNFPAGRIFDGYRNRLWQRETIDGVEVIRLWTYITANEGFLRRTLDYVSFMAAAIVATPFLPRTDVVVSTSPQFFTPCAAYVVSRLKRRPWVFELRDLWPDSIVAVGAMTDNRLIRALRKLEYFLYRRATRIVSVTHSFREILSKQPDVFKPMAAIGAGVYEIIVDAAAGWYRVMYVAKFEEAVYVLHSFQKKTNKTYQGDKDVAKRRYGAVLKERKAK